MGTNNQQQLPEYAMNTIRHKARQLVGNYGYTESDVEDIEQALALDLIERLPRFNPEKASLNTFCARVIDRQISKIVRHRKREKRDYRRESTHLNAPVGSGGDDESSYVDVFDGGANLHHSKVGMPDHEDETALRLDVEATIERLPEDLKPIAECLRTENVLQASRTLGMPRSTLIDAIKRIRLFFEGAGLKVYLA